MSYRDEPNTTEIRLDGLSDDEGELMFQGEGEVHQRRSSKAARKAARKKKWKERRKKVGVTCSDVICKKSVRYRFGYGCAVAIILMLVCTVPHTTLWNADETANGGAFFSFMFVTLFFVLLSFVHRPMPTSSCVFLTIYFSRASSAIDAKNMFCEIIHP